MFDQELSEIISIIKGHNAMDNTVIVVTSDNGMPFPRAKATLYDFGLRVPLAISWGDRIKGNRIVDDFVNLTDLAPTFLEVAGCEIPSEMTGKSLVNILKSDKSGIVDSSRDYVITGRERHAWCRIGGLVYGARIIRTSEYLYIRNYEPDRLPAGDPSIVTNEGSYGDVDASPSKAFILYNKNDPEISVFYKLAFGKRPSEELYDCINDPFQMTNIANDPKNKQIKQNLSDRLTKHLISTRDPRETDNEVDWDNYPYYGRHDWESNPGR